MKGIVSFYGKTGCKGNARQIEQLKNAGYAVQVIDLLAKKWDSETLLKFFCEESVYSCVNMRAPQITSGEFKPNEFDEAQLLQAMIENPILIKRPLLFYRGEFGCGFDHRLARHLLGEQPVDYACQQHDKCSHRRDQAQE